MLCHTFVPRENVSLSASTLSLTIRSLGWLTGERFAWVIGHRKMDLLAPGIVLSDWLATRRLCLRAI
jgi:hypothetical protein